MVSQSAVLDRLHDAPDLSAAVQKQALSRAVRSLQDPVRLNDASWAVACKPDAAEAAYRRALLQAEEACRRVGGNGEWLNTLGVAQYRAGQYQAALDTLMHSEKLQTAQLKGPPPADLAFLAMAQQQVGQTDQACATLVRLREAMSQPRWTKNQLLQGFLKEAEKLIPTEQP
jgi:hypothetical protein